MRSISWGEIGAPMFAWLRIIATSSMGGFNSLGGQVLPSQAPVWSPLKHRSGKPARGEREAGEHSPRDGFRDESVVRLASQAGGRQILAQRVYQFESSACVCPITFRARGIPAG